MKFSALLFLALGLTTWAAPTKPSTAALAARASDDNDEYVVYPDVDRDEDVVYAYQAVNDK